jgi:acyl-coenzyme A thioesterase PaaI-like protein
MSRNLIATIANAANKLPAGLRTAFLSTTFGKVVPFVGTAGVRYELLTAEKVICTIKNRRGVQNHINSVHAVAMGLIAETATGFVVAMNLADGEGMVLIKSMKLEYKKLAKGNMTAVATLTASQREEIRTSPKGEVTVNCIITDETGQSPVECEMVWAWVVKRKKAA